jgi:hypothetical protein
LEDSKLQRQQLNEQRNRELEEEQAQEEDWIKIDQNFTLKHSELQAKLISWPELLENSN